MEEEEAVFMNYLRLELWREAAVSRKVLLNPVCCRPRNLSQALE